MTGYNRLRFLLQSLKDLERQFAAHGIHFMCFYGEPDQIIENLIKEWGVKILSYEKDSEVIWRKRDSSVRKVCDRHGVQIVERVSHTLYDPEVILFFKINIRNKNNVFRRQNLGFKKSLMPIICEYLVNLIA
jgi:cryptochrome